MITNHMPNTIHDTDAVVPTSSNTAISLWHKFATWQNEMDHCRTLVRSICDEQDQIRAQMKELLHIREEEGRKIKAMGQADACTNMSSNLSETPSLEQLRELQRKLDSVEEQYRTTAASLEATKQKYQNRANCRQEIVREFIGASRVFHSKCQRARYDLLETTIAVTQHAEKTMADVDDKVATSCQLHTLQAVLCANATQSTSNGNTICGVENTWLSKTIEDLQNFDALHATTLIDFDESSDENDPLSWKTWKEKDFELHRTVELYTHQREKNNMVEDEMEQLQSKYDTLKSKVLDRDRRKLSLQAQLQRIRNDCATIEQDIDQCQQLIMEDEALAHTYQSKMDKRNQHQSTNNACRRIGLHHGDPVSFEKLPTQHRPSTLASLIPPVRSTSPSTAGPNSNGAQQGTCGVQNPYAKTRKRSAEKASGVPHVHSTNLRHHQDLEWCVVGRPTQPPPGTIVSTPPNENESLSRKNHRRRSYRDRWEFGCSLEVGTNADTPQDDIAKQDTSFISRTADCHDGDAAGGTAVVHPTGSYNQGQWSTTTPSLDEFVGTLEKHSVQPDEDDELLSFVAFPVSHGRYSS